MAVIAISRDHLPQGADTEEIQRQFCSLAWG
jgi:hypothetical protein